MSGRRFILPFVVLVLFCCFIACSPFNAEVAYGAQEAGFEAPLSVDGSEVGIEEPAPSLDIDPSKDRRHGDDNDDDDDDDDDEEDEGDDDDDDDDDRGHENRRCREKKVEGFITEINPASGTLVVGVVLVRTDEDTRIDLLEDEDKRRRPSTTLDDLEVGDYVRVDYCGNHEGTPLAIRIREKSSEHRFARVEGPIEEIDLDLLEMVVNSVLVRTTGTTEFRSVHQGRIEFDDLAVGDYVQVFGRPMTDASIAAIKVHRKRNREECHTLLRGLVNDVNVDSGTLVVGIVEVHTLSVTQILDASGASIGLADLEVGDFVKVNYCRLLGVPVASRIQVVAPENLDVNEDGEVSHRDILDLIRERCGEGVLLDFDGDNRTTGRDLFRFSPRWRGRRH